MGLLEQQNFLARLFTDEDLRAAFWENPDEIGRQNGLDSGEIRQIREISAADFNFFADSLIHKRLHEVEKILPLCRRTLDKKFSVLFQQFSRNFQPRSVNKHFEEAIEFCRYLQKNQKSPVSDVAKFEQVRHEFFRQEKFFSYCFLRFDITNRERRIVLAVWLRLGKKVHHFIL